MQAIVRNKEGKKIVKEIVDDIKKGLQDDEFNEAMQEVVGSDENSDDSKTSQGFDFKELFGGEGDDDSDDDPAISRSRL